MQILTSHCETALQLKSKDLLMHFSKLLLPLLLLQMPGVQRQSLHTETRDLYFFILVCANYEPGGNPEKAGSPIIKTLYCLYISVHQETTAQWLQVTQFFLISITPFTS